MIKELRYFKKIEKQKIEVGTCEDYVEYKFLTPWIALNQKNIKIYESSNFIKREEILKKILIGNVLSMSKGMDYKVRKELSVWLDIKECQVNFKGISMKGFTGRFRINFKIPDYLGIGKMVSRGFGTVKLFKGQYEKVRIETYKS